MSSTHDDDDADCDTCKFWLRPVRLAYNDGMSSRELNELSKFLRERRVEFERKWFEYFA